MASASDKLLNLTDDALFLIFEFCDIKTLGRIACTCKKLRYMTSKDCLWVKKIHQETVIRKKRWEDTCIKEAIRLGHHFVSGNYIDTRVIHHREKQIPWLQLDQHRLWISQKNIIKCYEHFHRGQVKEFPSRAVSKIETHGDVCRFKSNGQLLVSGSRRGVLSVHSAQTGEPLMQKQHAHTSDVHDVDISGASLVSGSRDNTVKIWSAEGGELELRESLDVGDRVWSVSISPEGNSFSVGTPGLMNIPALRIFDLHSGSLLRSFHHGRKYGAGVLHVVYESPHIMYSCGYDTSIRMWDLRADATDSVLSWLDPDDSTVYCVAPDGGHSLLSGTAYHAVVRLWDTRRTTCVTTCYVHHRHRGDSGYSGSSPVYSLAHSSRHLYVALDRSVNVLDSDVYKNSIS